MTLKVEVHPLSSARPEYGEKKDYAKIEFGDRETLIDKESAWDYSRENNVERGHEDVKICLECLPEPLISLKRTYKQRSHEYSKYHTFQESRFVHSDPASIKAYSLRFPVRLTPQKEEQVLDWILQQTKSIEDPKNLAKHLEEIEEHLQFLNFWKKKGPGTRYIFYSFLLCEKHQPELEETVKRIKNAFLDKPPKSWGFTDNSPNRTLRFRGLHPIYKENFFSERTRLTLVNELNLTDPRLDRFYRE